MTWDAQYIVSNLVKGRTQCPECGRWNVVKEGSAFLVYDNGAYKLTMFTRCRRCESELITKLVIDKIHMEA